MNLKTRSQNKLLFAALVAASLIVFGAGRLDERLFFFDHGLHVADMEIGCVECHDGMGAMPSGQRSMPDHDVCGDCHDVEDDCVTCHVNPNDPMPIPAREPQFEWFAHENHAEIAGDCENCHGRLTEKGEEPLELTIIDCRDCHQQERPIPQEHHLTTWPSDHGLEAAISTSQCEICHSQSSCDECHQGVNIYGSPHPPSWVFDHFVEAAFGGDCLVCHESRESCTACHRSMITIPHEIGGSYANPFSGGTHIDEFRSFSDACIACHDLGEDDPTCVRCHDE